MRRLFFELSYLLHKAPWDTGATPPELEQILSATPRGRALDIGCGTGTNAVAMARCGWLVTAVDFSARAVRQARRKARDAGIAIDVRRLDVAALHKLPGGYDLALDIGCFHSLRPEQQALYASDLARLVRPGGLFLLYGFEKRGDSEPSGWVDMRAGWIDAASLQRNFGGSFRICDVQHGMDRTRPSLWATLQRTA